MCIKMGLALNSLKWLMCYKTQAKQTKPKTKHISSSICKMCMTQIAGAGERWNNSSKNTVTPNILTIAVPSMDQIEKFEIFKY